MTDQDLALLRRTAQANGFDHEAVTAYLLARPRDWRRAHRLRGVTCIHQWLEPYPGNTWQEKWVAADGDAEVEEVFIRHRAELLASGVTVGEPTLHPRYFRQGLGTLIALGLVRPSPRYLLLRSSKIALKETLEEHREDIERVISLTARVSPTSEEVARSASFAFAAMIATTGRPLAEVTVEDWVAAEATHAEMLQAHRAYDREMARGAGPRPNPREPLPHLSDTKVYSLRWPYAAAIREGAVAPHPHPPAGTADLPPTLDIARAKPRTHASILETHDDVFTGRLYDLVLLTFDEWYGNHDFNTRRDVAYNLSVFLRSCQSVSPRPSTLRFERRHAAAIIDLVGKRRSNDGSQTIEREAIAPMLQTVRRFYEYAALTVEEYEELEDLVGPFPIPRGTVKTLAKRGLKRTASRLHSEIRRRITTIDDLVIAALWLAAEASQLREAAEGTPNGGCFEHGGVEYRRRDTPQHPDSPRQIIQITRTDRVSAPRDVALIEHRAIRTSAFIIVLRHTGIRREEGVEIARDDLGFAQIGGTPVPSLQVGFGKTDTQRTLALHSEAIEALVKLMASHEKLWGEIPLATRRDEEERQTLAPRRYLFSNYRHGAFRIPAIGQFAEWIAELIDDHNALAAGTDQVRLAPMRPHDFRRIFATDLLEKDVPIESVRQLLGHANISTTAIYDHTSWDRAASKFLESHRTADAKRTKVVCLSCNGTGLLIPHNHEDVNR